MIRLLVEDRRAGEKGTSSSSSSLLGSLTRVDRPWGQAVVSSGALPKFQISLGVLSKFQAEVSLGALSEGQAEVCLLGAGISRRPSRGLLGGISGGTLNCTVLQKRIELLLPHWQQLLWVGGILFSQDLLHGGIDCGLGDVEAGLCATKVPDVSLLVIPQ